MNDELQEFLKPEPVIIKAENVSRYAETNGISSGWDDLLNFRCSRPPFPSMRIDFSVPRQLIHGRLNPEPMPVRINVRELPWDFTVEVNTGSDELSRLSDFRQDLVSKGLETFVCIEPIGRISPMITMVGLNDKGAVLADDKGVAYLKILSPLVNCDIATNNVLDFTTMVVLATLNFLNCRNVEVIDNPPSRQVRRHCERTGEPLPVTYKTLIIHPNLRRRREMAATGGYSQERALHIVRGHFKDFSTGKGLGRGHAHGLWWWSPNVRGTSTERAVVKDYSVQVN